MKTKKRFGSEIPALIGLLLVFCVVSFQIALRTPSDTDDDAAAHPRRTTASSARGGWKAFYLTLKECGISVDTWTRAPDRWPKDASVMICGPAYDSPFGDPTLWTDIEAHDALNWVADGGTIVLMTEQDDALTAALHLTPGDESDKKSEDTLVPAQPAPFLQGVKRISVPANSSWDDSPNRSVTLFGGKKPVVVVLTHGKGYIVAIASSAIPDNQHIGERDNATFLVNTVNTFVRRDRGNARSAVLFDEYHQGYVDDDTLWTALGRPGQLIVYQLLALTLLVAYSAGRRFGLPRPLPEASRVSSEYVASLADLYRRASASDAALEGIYGVFRRDICRAGGSPNDAPVAEVALAASLALNQREVEPKLQALMDTCEAKISAGAKALPESELLQLVRDIDAMRKELDLGGSNRIG